MKRMCLLVIAGLGMLGVHGGAAAQVAGGTTIGVTVTEHKELTHGWSAKRQILGKPLYNENNEQVGSVDDIIIAPNRTLSYAIVGAGGFLGLGKHDVAIPVDQIKTQDGKLTLPGATKDVLSAMPAFEYAQAN
jgi:PRC-barrel domain